ncbi:MAG: tannase/feruloyl esterase family alpha/beta hydrolase [Acidobacteriia bacterium]|nr:tannase/feruloyl esterase family alpha/beta hydrolase [Terriglobia bacterium]
MDAEFCRVEGTIAPSSDSNIEFEVWLPISGWNGKDLGVGNGGFAGSIVYRSADTLLPASLGTQVSREMLLDCHLNGNYLVGLIDTQTDHARLCVVRRLDRQLHLAARLDNRPFQLRLHLSGSLQYRNAHLALRGVGDRNLRRLARFHTHCIFVRLYLLENEG